MSKKHTQRRRLPITPQRPGRSQRQVITIIAIVVLLSLAGGILARWRVVSTTATMAGMPSTAAPVPSPPAPSLAREYIYAGGKLVAIEEPSNINSLLSAPTSFVATTTVATTTLAPRVSLNWTASSGPVHHYQIERRASVNDPFMSLADSPTTTTFTDTSVAPGTAYLYRVRAVDAAGYVSPESNFDLATAVAFDDDPLGAPPAPRTIIRAQHLFQLRNAINAARLTADLAPYSWTHAHDPQPGLIYAQDVRDMRTALDQALTALNLPVQTYTDQVLTTGLIISRHHFQELRDRVK